ncbi:MAG TPA: ZIP family metal transporter [Pirellulales bacterium]
MNALLLLAIYSGLAAAASLLGGWIPLAFELTHRRMQIAISFVSGVILGVGVLHLLPHAFEVLGSIDRTVSWLLGGFLFMFFLERFFHFHHHDAPDELATSEMGALPAGHAAAHAHHHHAGPSPTGARRLLPWSGAAIGLTLHGLIDGVAIAAAVEAEHDSQAWAGLATFLAIALHKPFDSLTIGTLLAAEGRSTALRHFLNACYALVTPAGAALFYLGSSEVAQTHALLGQALAFAAGAFICIATSDLLPELQFHRHDRGALSVALLAGIALAWATVLAEGGHDHGSGPPHEHLESDSQATGHDADHHD